MVVGIGVQQPGSQIEDTIDSHASMREEAIIRRKSLLRGRIVHVDRLAVWHVDTKCAQGILLPGSWRKVNPAKEALVQAGNDLAIRPPRSEYADEFHAALELFRRR